MDARELNMEKKQFKAIAKKVKISERYLHYLLKGERTPSPLIAIRLEEVTGINRRSWTWPEKYGNRLMGVEKC